MIRRKAVDSSRRKKEKKSGMNSNPNTCEVYSVNRQIGQSEKLEEGGVSERGKN